MRKPVFALNTVTGGSCLPAPLKLLFILILSAFLITNADGQSGIPVNERSIQSLQDKYGRLSQQIEKSTIKAVQHMQQQESLLRRKLQSADSTKAAQLFNSARQRYKSLLSRLQTLTTAGAANGAVPRMYFPSIDSVHTSMAFLASLGSAAGMSQSAMNKITQLSASTQLLQQRTEIAAEVQTFLSQRESVLKQQLGGLMSGGQMLGLNKTAYYYQQQLAQYREMLNNKDQLEEKVLASVQQMPGVKQFWQKNSALAGIFSQSQVNGAAVASGLPSRQDVQKSINNRLNIPPGKDPTGSTASGMLQERAAKAQDNLSSVKDQLAGLGIGGGGSSTMTMPDFTPNSQRGKRLADRIELGFSLQTAGATTLLPVTLQPALYAGYRFSDRFTAGVGVAWFLGLGQSIQKVQLSNQGVGLRSYADIKAKGSFWFTCGFEYNYMQEFSSLQMLSRLDVWQKSALAGIMKSFRLGRKTGKIQLLYDFLYATETPNGKPIVFRTAYSF